MAVVTSFCAFFGCGSSSSGGSNYTTNDSIAYTGQLQIEHFGKDVEYVNEDTTVSTFRAIVHKERIEKIQTENGYEELILRDVGFPSDNTTGRATVLRFAEMRINGTKYQVFASQLRSDFWHVTLKRVSVGEVSRSNRRGRM
jgi:hypothetical protein